MNSNRNARLQTARPQVRAIWPQADASAANPNAALAAALTGNRPAPDGAGDSAGAAYRMLGGNAGNLAEAFLNADTGVQGDFSRLASSDAGSRSPFLAGRDFAGLGVYQPDNARAMLAEGLRQYASDPHGFQSAYPEAARFFRDASGK